MIGSQYGKHKWFGSKKSLEGTFAAILSVIFAGKLFSELFGGSIGFTFIIGAILSCLMEAFTPMIDNLLLPLFFMAVMVV